MKLRTSVLFPLVVLFAGCGTLAGNTNMLSDERIRSEVGGTLGLKAEEVTIVDRRTEGTNTYVNVRTANRQNHACVINGGNMLSFGMTNPPVCSRR
jgi:hypothetical protein